MGFVAYAALFRELLALAVGLVNVGVGALVATAYIVKRAGRH